MTNDPFATLVANAELREAQDAARREQERTEAAARRQAAQAAEPKVDPLVQKLRDFGHRFLAAVAKKVVNPEWKPAYIRLIQQYSEILLRKEPYDLPKIDPRHAAKILSTFGYGIQLMEQHGVTLPEGTFYGQQLLAEREAESAAKAAPAPLRIVKAPGLKTSVQELEASAAVPKAESTEAGPAITRKGSRRKTAAAKA